MAVNLTAPDPKSLHAVDGVTLGVAAGIRKADRKDLLVVRIDEGARVAAVFTQNRFCAAPVIVAREHLSEASPRALVVNTGCANAGTGKEGLAGGARDLCEAAALTRLRAERRCCRFPPASSWSRCRSIASWPVCRSALRISTLPTGSARRRRS